MADGSTVIRKARAKVNLALHVTGRRDDGYHLLDSLVAFAAFGDLVTAKASDADSFAIVGPGAGALQREAEGDNLVIRARDALRSIAPFGPVAITLDKRLPVASGLGGGSADAAATLDALIALFGLSPDPAAIAALAVRLGADVPMCLAGHPLRARGIGEDIVSAGGFPPIPVVIANPGVPVSTPDVFRALACRDNPPLEPLPHGVEPKDWISWLGRQRNDLEAPAQAIVPAIADLCIELQGEGAMLARMSGSGASVFGLFETISAAEQAAARMAARHPRRFVVATLLEGSSS